ncbi:hypothetical protein [Sphingobacterium thalpophilum]|uniref:hypothetical protein n=1 Tax=Sphingobacterium thalpophilum TaxID=259 RepID=UPI0024A79FF6|nr:hypothetical protein [Sphingobacterium thalpophilum]
MNTTETKDQYIFESEDDRGKFQIRLHTSLRQIQIHSSIDDWDNEDYIDVNPEEVIAIRDMLTTAIDQFFKPRKESKS